MRWILGSGVDGKVVVRLKLMKLIFFLLRTIQSMKTKKKIPM